MSYLWDNLPKPAKLEIIDYFESEMKKFKKKSKIQRIVFIPSSIILLFFILVCAGCIGDNNGPFGVHYGCYYILIVILVGVVIFMWVKFINVKSKISDLKKMPVKEYFENNYQKDQFIKIVLEKCDAGYYDDQEASIDFIDAKIIHTAVK